MRDALGTGFGDGVYALDARATLWGPNLYLPWSAEAAGPVSAVLAATLAGDSVSAQTTVGVTAALAATLAGDSVAATASVGVTGTLSATLAGDTVAATAVHGDQGGGSGSCCWLLRSRRRWRRR